MATTTIINKATFKAEYASRCGSSLLFPTELWDCKRYVHTAKLRKKLNLKGRGRIIHIIAYNDDHPLFINVANKDVEYKTPVCCSRNMSGATPDTYGYTCDNPIGHIIVVLAE
jgi:hypothetical protein